MKMPQTRLPIRIEEHRLKDSSEIVKRIFQESFRAKQRWFGIQDMEPEGFNPLFFAIECYGRLKLGKKVNELYNGLGNYHQEKIKGIYEDFQNYNTCLIKLFRSIRPTFEN